ncbi:MAG: hypothetical protein WCO28_12840, partial [Bacteroidota bacterium]
GVVYPLTIDATHLTGTSFDGTTAVTIATDAASSNSASTIVSRDASGNFSAGTITASLTGNATMATRASNISGGAAGSIPYQTGVNATSLLAAGTSGQVLTLSGTTPIWATASGSGVPYSGANQAVNLGAYDLTVNGLTVGHGPKAGTGIIFSNTAIGDSALKSNIYSEMTGAGAIGGYGNTAIGQNSLYTNTSGYWNTASGYQSLYFNTSGHDNTASGNQSLYYNTNGSYNIADGPRALFYNTTGFYNTAYGNHALYSNTTGSNNTAIGYLADVATNNLTNATAIGYGAIVNASNTIQLGNANITNVKTSGTITASGFIIPGGTSTQVLLADGSYTTIVREVSDEFSATVTQTNFTLTQTPSTISKVKMYINGIRISNTAYSISGTTLTYTASFNGNYSLSVSDRIQMDYFY